VGKSVRLFFVANLGCAWSFCSISAFITQLRNYFANIVKNRQHPLLLGTKTPLISKRVQQFTATFVNRH
jgi:hypothetical protein